jgi:hypothetical protein
MRAAALLRLGLALAGFGLSGGCLAAAQAVYRCAPNVYSQQPCDGGQRVAPTDARSPEQAAEARAASAGQMKLADRMQRERLAMERTRPLSSAVSLGPMELADGPAGRAPKQVGTAASRKIPSKDRTDGTAAKPYKPGGFVAFAPGPAKPKRPAERPKKSQD